MTDPLANLAEALLPHIRRHLGAGPQKRYLTLADAAERLSCSRAHVKKLVAAGELEAINIGSGNEKLSERISIESIEAFELRRVVA